MPQSPRSHFGLTTHLYVQHTFYVSICVLDSHICHWVTFNYVKSSMLPKVNFFVGCSSSVCRLLQDYHSFPSCPDRSALCCSYIYHPTLFPSVCRLLDYNSFQSCPDRHALCCSYIYHPSLFPFPLFAGCYKITTVFIHAQTIVLCFVVTFIILYYSLFLCLQAATR